MEQRLAAALERSSANGLQFSLSPETAAKLQALADAKGITPQAAAEELLSILLNLPGSQEQAAAGRCARPAAFRLQIHALYGSVMTP